MNGSQLTSCDIPAEQSPAPDYTVNSLDWNNTVSATTSQSFGFNGSGSGRPTLVKVTQTGASGSGVGGSSGVGGAQASGGAPGTGGANGSGGVQSSGGVKGSGGATSSGGAASPGGMNPPITGSSGFATRYWDCCKPSCGWTGNSNPPVPSCSKDGQTRVNANTTSACDNGDPNASFECYDFSPWFDSSTNMAYGFAAYNGAGCGTCYELQFTGTGQYNSSDPGSVRLRGQQMIVQVINIGNIAAGQFDLLIPGGGVGDMTKGCTAQWGAGTDFGATYGGLLAECNDDSNCMKAKCQSVFGSYPSLLAGCNWFTGWFSSADNPQLVYKQVSCPQQLTAKTNISR
jgi:Glycosyl hydrolase family 45